MKGEILAIIVAMIWGFVPILDKLGILNVHPFVGNFVRSMGSFVFMFMIFLYMLKMKQVQIDKVSALYLFTAGLLAGGLAGIIYYFAMKFAPVSRVIPLTSLYPFFAAIFSIIFLGENVTPRLLIGILFIILGTYLILTGKG